METKSCSGVFGVFLTKPMVFGHIYGVGLGSWNSVDGETE